MSVTNLKFQEGCIPEALTYTKIVIIPKGVGKYRGIGIVEVV